MLAMGFSNEPALLIADEPTTALDVTIQAQILDLLRGLNADLGTAIILISHDLGVIANICSRVLVMYAGEVVEEGSPEELLSDPRHPYTWALLNAAPRLDSEAHDRRLVTIEGQPPDPRAWPTGCRFRARCPFAVAKCEEHPALLPAGEGRLARCWVTQAGEDLRTPARPHAAAAAVPPRPERAEPLLLVQGLRKHFDLPRDGLFGSRRVLQAVDGVDLTVQRGETVGLVGESGCGKSTLARLVTRLHYPDRGRDPLRRAGHHAAAQARDPAAAPAYADDLPGSLRLAQPAHVGGADPGRPAALARHRAGRGGSAPARRGAARRSSACRPRSRALPARILRRAAAAHLHRPRACCARRTSSWRTSRSRRST